MHSLVQKMHSLRSLDSSIEHRNRIIVGADAEILVPNDALRLFKSLCTRATAAIDL